jgi:hypothetical protein
MPQSSSAVNGAPASASQSDGNGEPDLVTLQAAQGVKSTRDQMRAC